jgi:thiamine biosynthesis lipoprotein ApbE
MAETGSARLDQRLSRAGAPGLAQIAFDGRRLTVLRSEHRLDLGATAQGFI